MRVLLVATYELGHQPLHVAAPAARLRERGHEVRCLDLSVEPWDDAAAGWADRIAFSVPMHTAMRIARMVIAAVRTACPEVPVCCFGLYAAMGRDVVDRVLAGETDAALVDWVEGTDPGADVHLGHGAAARGAPVPARDLLPSLDHYARLVVGDEERTVAYVEASHGCAHRCRHCPVPVVYDGRIRVVDVDAVVADVAQQVGVGARHVTFGDPDFLNGVHHSLRVVRAVHEQFPNLTFDCTAKVEHVLRHADIWAELAASGLLFVVSAFESVDDATLARLDKGHTTADAAQAVRVLRRHGVEVRPSWMPFTPWTTLDQVRALLDFVAVHDLVANVDPVQYAIRLLVPRGSLLLAHPDLLAHLGPYDHERGTYAWRGTDPVVDDLQHRIAAEVEARTAAGEPLPAIYDAVRVAAGLEPLHLAEPVPAPPRLTEPWFCCAEPTALQIGRLDHV